MFTKPNPNPNFSELEDQIINRWKENQIFEKSIEIRNDSQEYIFYDGPPFMSGMPHYATLLSSLPKDTIPRYQTMKGKKVQRVWGWDCHGLPIENKVEKELGLTSRKDIEAVGLERFIEKCYEWNRVGIENWRWYIEKIGRWADLDNAYRTLDQDFMESVWWVFKEMWNKGLIYKGLRTSLFSTDSSTPVSNFEVSMDPDNYRDTKDIAVSVKFKLTEDSQKELAKKINSDLTIYLVAWTTTPWTLPSNFALAVNPEAKYKAFEYNNEIIIVAEKRAEEVLKTIEGYKEISIINSKDLVGLKYVQLYEFLQGNENDFTVYESEYVTTEDGTGILHVAPAFGEEDFNLGKQFGLSFLADIDDDGKLIVGPWKGMYLRDANLEIMKDLKATNKLLKKETYTHRLPYYRYENPLIYKIQENYFINIQKLKELFLKSNEEIKWVPEHFKDGRFKNVIETAPDWSISRSRYWGTVMPIWQAEDGGQIIVGSRDELMELVNKSDNTLKIKKVVLNLNESDIRKFSDIELELNAFIDDKSEYFEISTTQDNLSKLRNNFFGETEIESKVKLIKNSEKRAFYLIDGAPLDLHRPYIDSIYFNFNGKVYRRIKETLDVWMDSGSMPFAQFHYPFVNKDKFEHSFPGDFIAEYTGQIRAWFYVLHVISNAIFEKPAFKNVLVTGVLAGTDGRKMSKSFGNYPDPKETLEKYGGEALRLYFLGSTLMDGNDMNFNERDLSMQVREFLIPLWNIYSYLTTYANLHQWAPRNELVYNKRNITKDEHPWDHIPFDDIDNNLDAWILVKLQKVIKEVNEAMDNYLLPKALKSIQTIIDDISKWYIRRSRDRFSNGDQSALDTLYYVLVETLKLFAPIAPFITEEIYQNIVVNKVENSVESIHLTDFPLPDLKFIDQYSQVLKEMELVMKITETGQSLRTTNNLKLRQPLSTLEVVNTNKEISALTDWMKKIISDELNVKEVLEKISLTKSDSMVSTKLENLGIEVGLETHIDESLQKEGFLREIIRNIQAARKNEKLNFGDKIKLELEIKDSYLYDLVKEKIEEIKEATDTSNLELTDLEEESTKFQVDGKEIKSKIIRLS